MLVDGKSAGIFQYDANTGRTITELDPAYRGQGLGQRLILKGIYTAAILGMNYVEDESRTAMFDRAMDNLADAGYIVNDDEYWYVTSSGEQFLKQGAADGSEQAHGWKIGKMYRGSNEPYEVVYVDASDEKTALAKAHHALKPNHMQILSILRRPKGVAEGTDQMFNKKEMEEASNPAQQAAIAINMKKKGIKPKHMSEHIDDGDYDPEYDDEAGMADNNLETLKRAVQGIDDIIQPGDNLPEWCQEKIAQAKGMLVGVWDYMKSEEDRGATAELAEEFDLIESIIDRIAAHNGVDAEVVWEDLESLTEDELYALARIFIPASDLFQPLISATVSNRPLKICFF